MKRHRLPEPGWSHRRAAAAVLAAATCVVSAALLVPGGATADASTVIDPLPGEATSPHESTEDPPFEDAPDGLPVPVLDVTAPDQVPFGSAIEIEVHVSGPSATGEIASLEQRDGDTWTAVGSNAVGADATAPLVLTPDDAGRYTYRVGLAATTRHDGATSDPFTVRVLPKPDPTPDPPPPGERPECAGVVPLKDDGTPWVCTYDDEFSGSTLNRRFWVPQVSATSRFFTGTAAHPACFLDDPRTVDVRGGDLVLSAQVLDEPVTCGTTTTDQVSGMVSHLGTFSQTYGKWEVRAKVPTWAGKGLQETFWLWPVDQLKYGYYHPASGEIDFAEFYSAYSNLTIPVMHYVLDPWTISYATSTNIYTSHSCGITVGAYNTYGLEWRPGQMKILVNGQVCITNNYVASNAPPGSPYAPFDSPFFLALTQAFGTTGNEFDPATGPRESSTDVDYVRVWQ